jgi:hypothetical protein
MTIYPAEKQKTIRLLSPFPKAEMMVLARAGFVLTRKFYAYSTPIRELI